MAKKVTLDTLDIEETSVALKDEPELVREEEAEPQVERPGRRWLRPLAIGGAVLSCLLIASAAYWWWPAKPAVSSRRPAAAPKPPVAAPLDQPNIQTVSDLCVPLRAVKGNQRVVVMDLVFELQNGQKGAFVENIVAIRSALYQTIHQKTAEAAVARGGMDALKGEMLAGVQKYLGKDAVKNIYFTRYIVL